MELGEKLKGARTNAGLKQEELAKQLGVSRQTISNWENGRSLPDIGSVVKLSGIYQLSLDEMLKDEASVLKTFEDLAAKRRRFWQMMLEIGMILELIGVILGSLEYPAMAYAFAGSGVLVLYIAIFMHLRVFDHDRGEILRGILGMCILLCCQILSIADIPWPNELLRCTILLLAHGLIWSSGVWTIDWKSTRLWLIIVLLIAAYTLPLGNALQKSGTLNTVNPFGKYYQVAQVLYPEDMEVPEYTKISLSTLMHIEDRYGNAECIGSFTYIQPAEGQSQLGIWQLIPEENPEAMYRLTVEADESILLAYFQQDQLQWKWLLTPYGRDTCFVTVSTFGSTMTTLPRWYAPGREDPEHGGSYDVVRIATMDITVGGLDTENLTFTEEYHHGGHVETTTYTLEPEKPGAFTMKLKTRYDGKNEWALYRIPFQDGEYRFTLTFGA